ncbi:MAG: trypsin-like peptidase domain-containing protein [Verrucomicrobiales bacterium]|nr:trypsin-like peptidase domain-containing protein [Verrucomicrobiales bacterium]
MKSPIFSFIITTLAWGLAPAQDKNEKENTNQANNSSRYEAVVRIENSSLNPDYRSPWNTGRDSGGNGTGWLVGENKFLTNAHVVSNSRIIYIKKVGDAKPYRAKIVHIAHDCDLAMLELEDPSAFEGVTPFVIGKLPQLDTTVKVIGYPIGGERISITSGVVSRIDFLSYSHTSVDLHLTIQIDAAINPGNSGGPVIQNGKVVGVAFQGYSGNIAQNTGYMIPTPVIRRFLKDVEDDNYDHYVDLSMSDFPLINPAQRKALGLANDGIGIMVAAAEEDGSAGGILKTGDVLLAIDGRPVKSNGLINYEGEDVNMNEIVERKFAGDVIKLKIWRQNKSIDAKVTLKRFLPYLIAAKKYDEKPRYIMFSGLVFQPLDRNLMAAHGMKNLQVRYHFDSYVSADIYKDRPEVIVLTSILPDSINSYFSNFKHSIVDEVNGVKVKTLKDVHNALAKDNDDYIIISLLGNGRPIVIERAKVEAAQKRIQEKYNVIKDHYLGD